MYVASIVTFTVFSVMFSVISSNDDNPTGHNQQLTFAYHHAKANFDIVPGPYFSRENRKVNDRTVFLITFVELFSSKNKSM